MELPNVVHPTLFKIKGFRFQIVSFTPLDDAQAANAAKIFYRNNRHKLKKADHKKVIRVITTFDEDSAKLL